MIFYMELGLGRVQDQGKSTFQYCFVHLDDSQAANW